MKMKTIFLSLIAASFLVTNIAAAELVVIVNANNTVSSLNEKEVKRIFLGKTKSFPGGGSVTVGDQVNSAERDGFYKSVTGKNAAQLKSYWSTMIFSGKGTPPKEIGNSADVVSWVAKTPGAIAYVDKSAVVGGVKTVYSVK